MYGRPFVAAPPEAASFFIGMRTSERGGHGGASRTFDLQTSVKGTQQSLQGPFA